MSVSGQQLSMIALGVAGYGIAVVSSDLSYEAVRRSGALASLDFPQIESELWAAAKSTSSKTIRQAVKFL